MLDGVLTGRVRRLQDQQDGVRVGRLEQLLKRAQLSDVLAQEFLVVLLRAIHGVDESRPFLEFARVFLANPKICRNRLHFALAATWQIRSPA
jgi:hypothetical protein